MGCCLSDSRGEESEYNEYDKQVIKRSEQDEEAQEHAHVLRLRGKSRGDNDIQLLPALL